MWKQNSVGIMDDGNEVLDAEGFYISYNPRPCFFMPCFRSDNGGAETALCDQRDKRTKFYILNGDFRKQYEKLVPNGFEACKAFYDKKKKRYGSSWSNTEENNETVNDSESDMQQFCKGEIDKAKAVHDEIEGRKEMDEQDMAKEMKGGK